MATDKGVRTDLDTAIDAFGLDRAELEAELADDLAAGVKMPRHEVDRLTPAQAQQIWNAYISSPRG